MEEQTKNELFAALELKIRSLKDVIIGPSLASLKERRQFPTKILSVDQRAMNSIDSTTPYYWIETLQGRPITTELLCLIKRSTSRVEKLKIKPSQKVNFPGSRHISMFDGLAKTVFSLTIQERMPTLETLFNYFGRSKDYEISMGGLSIQDNIYVQSLVKLLSGDNIPLRSEWGMFAKMWPKMITCDLLEKTYYQRGEVRAFVSDKDPLRTLIGAAVHSLLYVKEAEHSDLPPFSDVSPKKSKHLISKRIFISKGFSLCILFGDISSFTASLKNIWIILIGLIQLLEESGENEIIVLDIKGNLIETNARELFRCYLYLASACGTRHEDEVFYSLGGMLGIAGIDTLCKVSFALFLRLLCKRQKFGVRLTPKAGGDDFTIDLIYRTSNPYLKAEVINWLHNEIQQRIGHIKALDSLDVPMESCDFITEQRYCKKAVRVVVQVLSEQTLEVRLESQWPIPLMRALLSSKTSPSEASEFWEATKSAPWVPEKEEIRDGLYALFAMAKQGSIKDFKVIKHFDFVDHVGLFTRGAMDILLKVTPVQDSNGKLYKVTYPDKLSSVDSSLLEWIPGQVGAMSRPCVAARGEIHRTESTFFYRTPDPLSEVPMSVYYALCDLKDLIARISSR